MVYRDALTKSHLVTICFAKEDRHGRLKAMPKFCSVTAMSRLGFSMLSVTHRRLSLWLAGLFLVAQIFGVVSLMNSHLTHVAEAELVFSDSARHSGGHGHHYRGDSDGAAQHHELHDLNGAFLGSAIQSDIMFLPAKITFAAAQVLQGAAPARLDRPPKAFLSV
jgi:hypothetical protein